MKFPAVNAYYNSLLNEIIFPAGILQPPFFNPKADHAINYGGMGVEMLCLPAEAQHRKTSRFSGNAFYY